MKRMIAILVLICLAMGIVPADLASTADNKPGTPSISVKLVNGTDAKITIGKTSGAKGYDVFITTDVNYIGYKLKKISTEYYYNSGSSGKYIHAATIKKDGSTSRTITIKNLSKGTSESVEY